MNLSTRRVRAIFHRELREYRRNRSIVVAIAIFPLIFLIQPLFVVFLAHDVSSASLSQMHLLLYMLAIPVLTPPMLAGYAVAGERQHGTLEPVLTTPIRREEFLVGKALAVLVPSAAIAYVVYALFLALVALFAEPSVASAIIQVPDILAQVLFTPLLGALSVWIGLAFSTRASDVRVAQQLSLLGSLPLVLVTSLIAFNVIHATLGLAVSLAALLLIADVLGWRAVSPLFDRERLVAGSR
ncbi:MAG: ABC transporter permease [Candidatus Limnocylindrales bacterium]|nr:ABC transporter permease [Candidatus Limnocylindrales bacterium]